MDQATGIKKSIHRCGKNICGMPGKDVTGGGILLSGYR